MLFSTRRQAGSAATFIIIAIILVIVTIGSVAFVVKRGEQARKDTATSQLAAQQAAQKAAQKAQDQAVKDTAAAKAAAVATTSSSTTSITSGALPTTGAELNITATIAVGLLTITATSFAASRRSLKRSL
jgi:type II secretory pathway pseudopilin PulG